MHDNSSISLVMKEDGSYLFDITYQNDDGDIVDSGIHFPSDVNDERRTILHNMLDEFLNKARPFTRG